MQLNLCTVNKINRYPIIGEFFNSLQVIFRQEKKKFPIPEENKTRNVSFIMTSFHFGDCTYV